MSDTVLRTVGLGKSYQIGQERQRYRTLRDAIVQAAMRPIERIRHPGAATQSSETLWALKDVDLEVDHGEVLGIIGRNGAGKSTLLKILSRITEPTEGRVEIRGRVGSLLEVGTGFHPELTGRENIQLNGAILGMSRTEIQSKFDEIVEFSEIGQFLDTPVKRYSSGMYVRLAFAVAAHLDPEVLVVDEVLSVGDFAFQRKCLGKMQDVAGSGRTVLFVSHNLAAVASMCDRVALLSGGRLAAVGPTEEIITRYLSAGLAASSQVDLKGMTERGGNGLVRFVAASILDAGGEPCQVFHIGDTIRVRLELERNGTAPSARFTVSAVDDRGMPIFHVANIDVGCQLDALRTEETIELAFEDCRLYPGEYLLSLWVGAASVDETYDQVDNCIRFEVAQGGPMVYRTLARHVGTVYLTPRCRRL